MEKTIKNKVNTRFNISFEEQTKHSVKQTMYLHGLGRAKQVIT